ncbi:MAG: hypothetical protein ACXW0S_08615 [Solirubrobacterales bacterium]
MCRFARTASKGWLLLAVILALAGAALVQAAAFEAGPATPKAEDPPGFAAGAATPQRLAKLRLSGHVGGLYPGASKRLRLAVRNPGDATVFVTAISTRVGGAGPGCGARNLRVSGRRMRKPVPPRATVYVGVRAIMRSDAADACQRRRFPLQFNARAEAAP